MADRPPCHLVLPKPPRGYCRSRFLQPDHQGCRTFQNPYWSEQTHNSGCLRGRCRVCRLSLRTTMESLRSWRCSSDQECRLIHRMTMESLHSWRCSLDQECRLIHRRRESLHNSNHWSDLQVRKTASRKPCPHSDRSCCRSLHRHSEFPKRVSRLWIPRNLNCPSERERESHRRSRTQPAQRPGPANSPESGNAIS